MKFKQSLKSFFASKTNWTCLTGIIASIAGYLAKEFTLSTALQMGLTSLSILFIRDAISGQEPKS